MSDLSNADFALPGDGRKAEAQREKRRLLYCYLRDGPRNFFKSVETIRRELTQLWPELGWSRRAIFRLLTDLRKLGLQEAIGRKGSQGTRIRRIYKGRKPESGTPSPPQGVTDSREKTGVQRESGTPTATASESGTPRGRIWHSEGRESGTQGSSLNSYSKKEGGFSLNHQSSSEGKISKEPKNDDAERDFQPNGKLSPKLLAWAETRVLARAEDPVRNQHAFLRKALPEFLANLDMEVQRWLTETLGKWIMQELHRPRLNPNIPAIVKPYEIRAFVHEQVEKYDLPITETQVSIAVQSCIDRLGLKPM